MTEQETLSGRQLFRISQKALFYDAENKKYLILKSAKTKKTSPNFGLWIKKYGPWDLPGGGVDVGKYDLDEEFKREIKEEIGIDVISTGTICHTEVMQHKDIKNMSVNLISIIPYDGEEIILSEEHVEYQWLSEDEIKEDKEIKPWIKNAAKKAEEIVELQESFNSWKRCLADFDNYKKRQSENQKEFTQYAAEGVISDMLPVLDNFHAATEHIPEGDAESPWVTGIMFIQQQMEKVFEESNVTKIEVNVGDEFDPAIMEAIKNDDDKELSEDAVVQKIAQPGYKIGEKVLRPARVVLG